MAVLTGLCLACSLFYALFLLQTAAGFVFTPVPSPTKAEKFQKVTVIVPARNEESSIESCLHSILANQYPSDFLEVILVDDHSEDRTRFIGEVISQKDPRLKVLPLGSIQGPAYKKAAISAAIQIASGEIILTTDADCTVPPNWVQTMVAAFSDKTAMVSGPVSLEGKSLFAQLQSLEFMGLVAVGAGTLRARWPTLCNGANLAYRKSVWFEVGGFAGIDGIASGDDELLMHKMATSGKWEVVFCKSPQAIVLTQAQPDWGRFRAQRLRWVSKSLFYKDKSITQVQAIAWISMLGLVLSSVLAALGWQPPWVPCLLLGLKLGSELAVLAPAAYFFRKLPLLIWLVPEQLLHIPYVLWVGLAANVTDYSWKGRTVR